MGKEIIINSLAQLTIFENNYYENNNFLLKKKKTMKLYVKI